MDLRPGLILGGSYRIERRLGMGAMGEVYEASHCRLRRRFAIKTLRGGSTASDEAYLRFRREAEIASQLGHPNIVEVIDFDRTEQGLAYMVMEHLEGEDLEAVLQREGRLPLDRVVALAKELASALGAAHARGVVHRDLKPQNIFLCRFGERTDLPKVLDFGISKIRGDPLALTGDDALLGTPSYMSPEQAQGRAAEADVRTDVFAMGAILYRALTGKLPFCGETTMATLFAIAQQDPAPPSRINPTLPAGMDRVLLRALAKRPDDRYPSVAALAEDLAAAMETHRSARTAPAVVERVASAKARADSVRRGIALAATLPAPDGPQTRSRPRARRAHLVLGGAAVVAALGALAVARLRSQEPPPVPAPIVATAPVRAAGRADAGTAPRPAASPRAPDAAAPGRLLSRPARRRARQAEPSAAPESETPRPAARPAAEPVEGHGPSSSPVGEGTMGFE